MLHWLSGIIPDSGSQIKFCVSTYKLAFPVSYNPWPGLMTFPPFLAVLWIPPCHLFFHVPLSLSQSSPGPNSASLRGLLPHQQPTPPLHRLWEWIHTCENVSTSLLGSHNPRDIQGREAKCIRGNCSLTHSVPPRSLLGLYILGLAPFTSCMLPRLTTAAQTIPMQTPIFM